MAAYRERPRTLADVVGRRGLAMNNAMLTAQAAAEQAGLRVEPLHIPYLLPEAIAHRCKVGRAGLG